MSEQITFVTVSYDLDVERFSLLRESIRRFYVGAAEHLVVVPKKDIPLFESRVPGDEHLRVLAQSDFVAPYFYPHKWYTLLKRIAPGSTWRFAKYAGVRGWRLQQPCKLSVPAMETKGVVVVLDSDVVFLRPFGNDSFGIGGKNRTLLRIEQDMHREQMEIAWRMLGRPLGRHGYHYTTMPMIMYPDWVSALQRYLETLYGKEWQRVVHETGAIHEDCVYGIFVEEIVKPEGLQVQEVPLSYMVWDNASLDRFLGGDLNSLDPGGSVKPVCVVLQSNLGASVSDYRKVVEGFWNSSPVGT